MKFHSMKFVYILIEFSNLVLNIKSSNVILEGQVMLPKHDSSEFEELYSSILESVIYKECKSFHLFLKSVLQMSLAFETECRYENYTLASFCLAGIGLNMHIFLKHVPSLTRKVSSCDCYHSRILYHLCAMEVAVN